MMTNTKIDQVKKKILLKSIGTGINALSIVAPSKAGSIALDIFRTPRKGRIQSYQKKFLKKFKQQSLKAGEHEVMTYDNQKSGRRVLLCHGWESNAFRWRKLYRELNKTNLNVILMDAPAHGASGSEKFDGLLYIDMIKSAVDYFKPEVIIGHSVGAYATVIYQSMHRPESVKDMILLASPDKFDDMAGRYFNLVGYSNRTVNAFYRVADDFFGQRVQKFNAADYAQSILIPGLIIHDKEDDVNLFCEGEAIHQAWKKSKLIPTSGFGHSLQDLSVYQTVIDHLVH